MSPVYLFIQIQILIGCQPNRFVTNYSKKKNQSLWNKLKALSSFYAFCSFYSHYVNLDCYSFFFWQF